MYDQFQERRMKHGKILYVSITTIRELDQWSASMAAMSESKLIITLLAFQGLTC